MDRPESPGSGPIVVVTACDENYAIGAAAAVRSAIGSVGSERRLRVFVLDGGITDPSKQRLMRSWDAPNVEVAWLLPDLTALGDLEVSGHVTVSTYLRILMAELLPADVQRAIYLDADTIVTHDLNKLWSTDLKDAPCAAVQDYFHPYLNPPETLGHQIFCETVGFNPEPIPNYRELGLQGSAPYFNAGIMLANIDHWRRNRVAARALECLRTNRDHVTYWDQYALNTLFSGQWLPIDPRWNQNTTIFNVGDWKLTHFSQAEFDQIRAAPRIIHFDYKPKPWSLGCAHPFKDLYFHWLDKTDWRGWRPRLTLKDRLIQARDQAQAAYDNWQPQDTYRLWQHVRRKAIAPLVRPLKDLFRRRRSKAA